MCDALHGSLAIHAVRFKQKQCHFNFPTVCRGWVQCVSSWRLQLHPLLGELWQALQTAAASNSRARLACCRHPSNDHNEKEQLLTRGTCVMPQQMPSNRPAHPPGPQTCAKHVHQETVQSQNGAFCSAAVTEIPLKRHETPHYSTCGKLMADHYSG